MKNILTIIITVLGWLVLLIAFASIGFATENPSTMVPVYFLFFLAVFIGIYFINKRRVKRIGIASTKNIIFTKVTGIVLVLVGILTPAFFFRQVGFTFTIHLLITFLTAILIVMSIIAIMLINKRVLLHTTIGYLLLILICSMPAVMMIQYDRSYHALGTAYYLALVVTILSWFGLTLINKSFRQLIR